MGSAHLTWPTPFFSPSRVGKGGRSAIEGQCGDARLGQRSKTLEALRQPAGRLISVFSAYSLHYVGGVGSGRPGGGSTHRVATRGRDYEQPIEIPLRDAFTGTTLTLQKDGQKLEVKVPAGVRTGSKIRMSGQGEAGRQGGGAGDLYLTITVQPDPYFERDGDDLKTESAVDLYTLILGGEVMVKTLSGQVSTKVPPETQPGRIIRLRGQGMPNLHDPKQRGDLYVKVQAKFPQHLNSEEKKLFEQLAKLRK